MRSVAFIAIFSIALLSRANPQTFEAVPKLEMLNKGHQIGAMIDMAYQIKAAVETQYRGRELVVYRAVSERLTGCSILYAMLSKIPGGDHTQAQLYDAAFHVYSETGSLLFPDGIAAYKQAFSRIQPEILGLRADKQRMFYFLRNCKDFAQPQSVLTAIQEIMLN